jgi:hypothetical protein
MAYFGVSVFYTLTLKSRTATLRSGKSGPVGQRRFNDVSAILVGKIKK